MSNAVEKLRRGLGGVEMMNRDELAPTLNLDNLDPHGADLDHIVSEPRALEAEVVESNNFAFGGIDTALIIRRVA